MSRAAPDFILDATHIRRELINIGRILLNVHLFVTDPKTASTNTHLENDDFSFISIQIAVFYSLNAETMVMSSVECFGENGK